MKVISTGRLTKSVTQGSAGAYVEGTVATNLSVMADAKQARAMRIMGVRYSFLFSTYPDVQPFNLMACVARESPGSALALASFTDLDTVSFALGSWKQNTSGGTGPGWSYYHDLGRYPELVASEELYVAMDSDNGTEVASLICEIVFELVQPTQQELVSILRRY